MVWAGDQGVETNVDGLVIYRANFIHLDGGESFVSYDLNSYFLVNKKYGLGLDATSCPEDDYAKLKPFATIRVAEGLDLVSGLSTNSAGADYVHAGVWYFGPVAGQVKVFLDPRFYFKASDEASNYFDGLAEISYPLDERFTLAFDLVYDHWWENGADWVLAGPVLYYKVNESTSIFVRAARETNFEGEEGTDIRLAVRWTF